MLFNGKLFKDVLLEVMIKPLIQAIEVIFFELVALLASCNDKGSRAIIKMIQEMLNMLLIRSKKRFYMHLKIKYATKFDMTLGILNFVLLLMRHEMNLKESK